MSIHNFLWRCVFADERTEKWKKRAEKIWFFFLSEIRPFFLKKKTTPEKPKEKEWRREMVFAHTKIKSLEWKEWFSFNSFSVFFYHLLPRFFRANIYLFNSFILFIFSTLFRISSFAIEVNWYICVKIEKINSILCNEVVNLLHFPLEMIDRKREKINRKYWRGKKNMSDVIKSGIGSVSPLL